MVLLCLSQLIRKRVPVDPQKSLRQSKISRCWTLSFLCTDTSPATYDIGTVRR